MANWDFMFAYDQRHAAWLEEMGYPCPPVLSGNRLPTTVDMKWALEAAGNLVLDYPEGDADFYVHEQGEAGFTIVIRGFNWDKAEAIPSGCFAVRWMCELQAALLVTLCRCCGQLFLVADHGGPAVIFQADMDPKQIATLYKEANLQEDSWTFFLNALYESPSLTKE